MSSSWGTVSKSFVKSNTKESTCKNTIWPVVNNVDELGFTTSVSTKRHVEGQLKHCYCQCVSWGLSKLYVLAVCSILKWGKQAYNYKEMIYHSYCKEDRYLQFSSHLGWHYCIKTVGINDGGHDILYILANSFRTRVCIRSGPWDYDGFKPDNNLATLDRLIFMWSILS